MAVPSPSGPATGAGPLPAEPGPLRSRYDVLVAGARCAGAATALLLARQGLDVLVVDPLPRGRDALSTHALMRGGVVQLHRWGLLDGVRAVGTPPVRTTTFDYGGEVIRIPIKPRDGVDALYAPRRTVLDGILVAGAEASGATVAHGRALASLERDRRGRVVGAWVRGPKGLSERVMADWVVGADGLRSTTAELVRSATLHRGRHRTACIYGYVPDSAADGYRWCFRRGVGAGLIPTNDGRACLFVSVAPEELDRAGGRGMEDLFRRRLGDVDPGLAERVPPELGRGGLRAFPGRPGHLRQAHGPGWALVGDAGFFRDPLTAHGITDALRDAELLARAVAEGTERAFLSYQAARDAVARGLMEVTDRIAALDWSVDEVQALHHELNRRMNEGLDVIRGWEADGSRAA